MQTTVRHILLIILGLAMLVAGCSGIEPYDPPDYKETPPGSGLLTGKDGEFIVYTKNEEQETSGEDKEAE